MVIYVLVVESIWSFDFLVWSYIVDDKLSNYDGFYSSKKGINNGLSSL